MSPAATKRTRRRAQPPQGREAVREALLEAATELFARHGPQGVSVRDVAEHAGVNHGLVHRHFGSKDALRDAVIERLQQGIEADLAAAPDGDLRALLERAFAGTASRDAYFRILARAMLDGEDPRVLQRRFPVVRRLVRAAEDAGVEDPRRWVARQLARGLGWLVFARYIRAATGWRGDGPP